MCSTVFYNQTQVRLRSTNTLPLFGELTWFGIMIMIAILNKKSRAVFFKMLFMVIKSILFVQVILLGLWPPLGHTLLSTVNFAASFPATGVHALARDARIRTTVPFLLGDEFWSHPSSQDARFIKATVWVAGPHSLWWMDRVFPVWKERLFYRLAFSPEYHKHDWQFLLHARQMPFVHYVSVLVITVEINLRLTCVSEDIVWKTAKSAVANGIQAD